MGRFRAMVLTLAISAMAQSVAPGVVLPDGKSIAARLDTSLNASKATAGEEVLATVAVGVVEGGEIVIPQGARLSGKVIAATARSKGNRRSMLMVRFDRAEWKTGSAALNAYIVGNLKNLPGAGRDNCVGHFGRHFVSQGTAVPVNPFREQSQNPNSLNGVTQPAHEIGAGGAPTTSVGGPPCAVAGPPDLHYISVHKLNEGGTQLISDKKNIALPAGIIVELRHVSP